MNGVRKEKVRLFDVYIDNVNLETATRDLMQAAAERHKALVVTPNVDHIITISESTRMKQIYRKAEFVLVDGMPLVWLSKLLFSKEQALCERVSGCNLTFNLCQEAERQKARIFLLGGQPGEEDDLANRLLQCFPNLEIAGILAPPFGFEKDQDLSARIVDEINASQADLLFVAVGSPKQEFWSDSWYDRLQTGPILCIGSAFEYITGLRKRAPSGWQDLGMEWLWRLLHEPRRLWRRYLIRDLQFLPLLGREVWNHYRRSGIDERNVNA